jgi:hypothetical protein
MLRSNGGSGSPLTNTGAAPSLPAGHPPAADGADICPFALIQAALEGQSQGGAPIAA